MTAAEPPPEPDRASGAPHPRHTERLFGQIAAETEFLEAYATGRLHHGWLVTGPRGVGKATLAWRIAGFLLAGPIASRTTHSGNATPAADTLDIPPEHPVARRISALCEPRLFLLRRPWDAKSGRLRAEITVEEARRLKGFFALSVPDGGRRVVIVDAADDMNVSAASAILKLLEEPPADTQLLLVSHQPLRLLPTILSRCRTLRCHPLAAPEMTAALAQAGVDPGADTNALTALAGGSAGTALRLISLDGLALYAAIIGLFTGTRDRQAALHLANSAAGRTVADRFDLMLDLFEIFLARLARTGFTGAPAMQGAPGEAAVMARLAPDAASGHKWATLAQDLGARARHGQAVNLDPAALILDMVSRIHQAAAATSA